MIKIKNLTREYVADNLAMATSAYIIGKDLSMSDTMDLAEKVSGIISIALDFIFTDDIEDDNMREQVIKIKKQFKGDK